MNEKEELKRLLKFHLALNNLEDISIPHNIIRNCLIPLCDWLEKTIKLRGEKINENLS